MIMYITWFHGYVTWLCYTVTWLSLQYVTGFCSKIQDGHREKRYLSLINAYSQAEAEKAKLTAKKMRQLYPPCDAEYNDKRESEGEIAIV